MPHNAMAHKNKLLIIAISICTTSGVTRGVTDLDMDKLH